ncbi:MAG: hypothetical protein SFU27_12300, partial [Thermonemataceae bacterium]|nr:hypothetical protein [Thermonemataceae bacterium]
IINADRNFTYEDNFMKVFFPDGALADTSYLDFSSKTSHFFIGNVSEPLVWDAHISYKYPKNSILHLDKAYLQGKGKSYIFSEKNDSIFRVQVDRLGDFKILKDEVPPFIKLIRKSPAKLVFQISDIGSGIKSFKGYLNGKFVLMEYEYKNSLLWTDPLFTETFIGDFELIVEDKVGNLKHYKLSL